MRQPRSTDWSGRATIARFNMLATRMIITALVPLSLALVLATHLVVAQFFGGMPLLLAAVVMAALIGVAWWLFPILTRNDRAP